MLYNIIQTYLIILLCAIALVLGYKAHWLQSKRINSDVIKISFYLIIADALIAFGMNLLMKSETIKAFIITSPLGKEITWRSNELLLLTVTVIIPAFLIASIIMKILVKKEEDAEKTGDMNNDIKSEADKTP